MNPPIRPPRSSKPRLHMLDGLRGVCAISIMFYHFLSWNQIELHQIGTFGVYIFFILSGFSLWYVYADTPVTKDSLRAFYVSRFARIFPLYTLVVLVMAISDGMIPYHMKNVLLNIFFLFGFASPGLTSIVTGGWSIGIEWVFYAVFPLLWVGLHHLRTMLVLVAASLALNQLYVGALFPKADFGALWIDYTQFPVFIVYFMTGIAGAKLFEWSYKARPAGLPKAGQYMAGFIVWLCLMLMFFYPSEDIKDYLLGWHFPLLILAGGVAVLFCAFIQDLHPIAVRVCKFLGDISFSTYLTHYFVFKYGNRIFEQVLPDATLSLKFTVFGVATVTIAWLLYKLYEAPARKYINQQFGGHRAY